jgi:hypothetical protein
MVYNTQNYWIFGRPSSGILKTREHNVSETGSVSILSSLVAEVKLDLFPYSVV